MEKPKLNCKLNVLSRSDGSAIFSEDKTVVMVGVCGPVEVKMQNLLIDKASIECNYKSKNNQNGISDRAIESIIRNVCESAFHANDFPRSSIVINVQEMQNNGHFLSCALNAACMACLNSGIDMKFIFSSVTCFLMKNGEFSLISPLTDNEIKARFVFTFDSVHGDVLTCHTKGCFNREEFEKALHLMRNESKEVLKFLTQKIVN